jgi:hypothetical protein
MSKRMARSLALLGVVIAALGLPWLVRSAGQAEAVAASAGPATQGTVEGVVLAQGGGPVEGAVVRWQTKPNSTTTAADGSFRLEGLPDGARVTITAWHEGYLIGFTSTTPPETGVLISMKGHYTEDNADYVWYPSNDPRDSMSCMLCMVAHPQWRAKGHANSATNPRFFSIYNGTDVSGEDDSSPGYLSDLPGTVGNCAACHAPLAVIPGLTTPIAGTTTITGSISADMNTVTGVALEGSNCEFCHKIGEVYLDETTGLPAEDKPGVLSMRLYRSPPGHVLWFGPFDDVARRVTYLPLEKKSRFCAPCHQFSFNGTPIYESYREWLESPYPELGIQCQTCHMPPTGVNYFAFPEVGGFIRDPDLIASHLDLGASDEAFLQDTVEMGLSARQVDGSLVATVTITNTKAGHDVPTDHPGRHMILVITVTDADGHALFQLGGPTVPDWGGDLAGKAGKAFAKVLRDNASGEAPVVSYWKPVTIAADNRIPAMGSDSSSYRFSVPAGGGTVSVTAELRFRRLFQDVMVAKDWDTPDIIMEQAQIELPTEAPRWDIVLPFLLAAG